MMNSLLTPLLFIIILAITISMHTYPLTMNSNFNDLSPSQIDRLCSYIETTKVSSPKKRFALPFPDMNRFLSTSHKLHDHHSSTKAGTEPSTTKHDFHAYLCSMTKDSEEMLNFISIFVEEHGQPPAFNLFESCEQIAKRDDHGTESANLLNKLSQVCSSRLAKRWKGSVDGPMAIDFIHQMLEARKVKSYPYSAEIDPYLVGR